MPITHIPVRIDDDAVRWDVTHTLVVAHPDRRQRRPGRPPEGARPPSSPHRYTIICPPLGRHDAARRSASGSRATLAELYRAEIDATGQPMSPEPLRRGAERDRALPDRRDPDLDPGRRAVEVARGGPDRRRRGITDKPVEHVEAGGGERGRRRPQPAAATEASLMESASVAVEPRATSSTTGRPEAHQSSRIDRQTLGILLFIVSEVMLFGAFFASYFFLRVVANVGPWPPDRLRPPGRRRRASTRRSWSPRASRSTTRWSRSARQPPRPEDWAWRRPGCSARPSCSSRSTSTSTSASAPATAPSARSSTASPACTAPTSSSG